MWLAIILSFIFGAIVCGCVIWGIVDCYDPNSCILTESEFRNKIANEPYDAETWSGYAYYKSAISSVTLERFNKYKKIYKRKAKIKKGLFICLPIFVWIAVIFGSAWFGAFLDNEELNRDVEQYNAIKYTIERSLDNPNLTGFERVELVKQASEQNSWLAEIQYDVQQWYNFYLNKDIVLELKMINLEGEE